MAWSNCYSRTGFTIFSSLLTFFCCYFVQKEFLKEYFNWTRRVGFMISFVLMSNYSLNSKLYVTFRLYFRVNVVNPTKVTLQSTIYNSQRRLVQLQVEGIISYIDDGFFNIFGRCFETNSYSLMNFEWKNFSLTDLFNCFLCWICFHFKLNVHLKTMGTVIRNVVGETS